MENLSFLEFDSKEPTKFLLIWLHGLGADGYDFEPMIPELRLPLNVRCLLPHAPIRCVTINGGLAMRAWYDIKSITFPIQEDFEGLSHSKSLIYKLIEKERHSVAFDHIYLGGFSQGGAMALWVGLTMPETLGGIISLSGYLPLKAHLDTQRQAANQITPIFLAHGTNDQIVPFNLGKQCYQFLFERHFHVSWYEYPMTHTVCNDEISHLSHWFHQNLYK